VVKVGGKTPPATQGAKPPSKPPLITTEFVACGVTAFDCAEAGPEPFGFDAVTVNVYVVPFARPLMLALVGAGVPVTVEGVWATPLI
jgi:hypothetical protein